MRRADAANSTSDTRELVHKALAEQDALRHTLDQILGSVEDHTIRFDPQHTVSLDPTDSTPSDGASPTIPPPLAPTNAPRIVVYCLGAFRLSVGGVQIRSWHSGRARALFQYLVNHRERPIAKDTLIEALWPDPGASMPGTSLKVAVHTLRQLLGEVGSDGKLVIEAHEAGYQLSAPDAWLDVEEFEHSFVLGRRLEGQNREADALRLYTHAAELYQGDFLEESWDDWVVFRREGLKDKYLFVLARLADAAVAARDYQGCIERCQRLLEKDPCREDTYRTIMLCHSRLGQRGRVRCWYELCVRTLRQELDLAPDPETEDVFRAALAGRLRPS